MVCEFFCNPPISSKSRCKTKTETQAETQTRKTCVGPSHDDHDKYELFDHVKEIFRS